jgi:regulatory protein
MAKGRLAPRDYLLFLLSRREYSEKELRTKLKLRTCTTLEVEEALGFIKELDLQSDARYASSKARAEARRKGNRSIRHVLASKGISAEQIALELQALPPEADRVLDAVRRFERKPLDLKLKGKVWRFLTARGFSQDAVKTGIAHLSVLERQGESFS